MSFHLLLNLITLFTCSLLFTCSKANNPIVAEFKPGFGIQKGQSWFYGGKTIHKNHILTANYSVRDYSSLRCARDTLLDGITYLIVKGQWYHCSDFYVDTAKKVSLVNIGDSMIKVLTPIDDDYSNWTVQLLKQKLDTLSYDSSTFYNDSLYIDLFFPVVLPIANSSMWFYRPLKDPRGNLPMVRRYIGSEEISVPGGVFKTMMFDFDYNSWCIGGTDPNCKPPNGTCTTWVAFTGNVKLSALSIDDSLSDTTIYTSELISNSNTPMEYVKPNLPNSIIDSAISIVTTFWSYQLFQSWLWSKPTLEFDSITNAPGNFENITAMMKSIWNCSLGNMDEVKAYLVAHSFPNSPAEYHNYNQFVEIILSNSTFIRGWIDCDTTQTITSSPKRLEFLKYVYPNKY